MRINQRFARRALAAAVLLAAPALSMAQSTPLLKSGTWWDEDESGWGLFTIDQGNVIAPGWFTYGPDGKPTWYLVPGARPQEDGSYTGEVCSFTGVPLAQISGSAADPCVPIGTAKLNFTGDTALRFEYTVNGQTQVKSLTRFPFGTRDVVCKASPSGSRVDATNYTDLWWSGPDSVGWGVHMTHVDDSLFATWYTYDTDRKAIFYIGATARQADGSFTGQLLRQNNGTPFNQINGSPASSGATVVGSVTLSFSDGENASFTYTIGGVTQTKSLSRFQFGSTTSICETVDAASVGGGGGGGGGTPGADECYPPLAVGDKYRVRSTNQDGEFGFTDAEVIGTGTDPFQGRPVFLIRYTPEQQTDGEVIEFVEQTDSERIYYGSEGYIPEVDARGTTRFNPPVRVQRSTPPGYTGSLAYQAISNYTAMGQATQVVIDFTESFNRVGTETQTTPAGTFDGACKFDTSFRAVTTISESGFSIRTETNAEVTQWAHPDIGGFRTTSSQETTATVTGAPFPVPPTVTNTTDLSEFVSALIGGQAYPR